MIKPRIARATRQLVGTDLGADLGLRRILERGQRSLPPATKRAKRARDGDSAGHLKLIAQCHCCVCWAAPPVHPHHLMRLEGEGAKGMGRRHADKWAIPLCARHHLAEYGVGAVHHGGDDEAVLVGFGIDGRGLALGLWGATGTLEAMERVNFSHHQRSKLALAQREYPGL